MTDANGKRNRPFSPRGEPAASVTQTLVLAGGQMVAGGHRQAHVALQHLAVSRCWRDVLIAFWPIWAEVKGQYHG